jgi:hypothetical protein
MLLRPHSTGCQAIVVCRLPCCNSEERVVRKTIITTMFYLSHVMTLCL